VGIIGGFENARRPPMLLFLNIDCVLDVPSDAAGPGGGGAVGLRRLESVLQAWPRWGVVVTSERRYRMTLEHFRHFFSADLRPRVVATTPLYDRRSPDAPCVRQDEVLDHLARHAPGAPWVAVDARASDYPRAGWRLVCCESFTEPAAAALQRALSRAACEPRVRTRPPPACAAPGAWHARAG